ncbi:class I SAM-dependent methyltransferase [Patescibacteria group bacterium]|nr:class I SAM-dependent methyltransferase [Patescibacteria group bacterium]
MSQVSAEIYLQRYLRLTPLSLALQRAVEAKHLASVVLKQPTLDLGCGFGEFAQVFFDQPVAVGVDICPKKINQAKKTGKYLKLVQADACQLPFKTESFNSVISVSALEHMTNPSKVLKEVLRVLKPEGQLVLTVVTDKWEQNLFYPELLQKVGLKKLADKYRQLFNQVFKHQQLLSQWEWEKHVRQAGFELKVSQAIVSPQIARFFDLFLITAWPAQLAKKMVGRRVVWRPLFMISLLTKVFKKYVDETEPVVGTNLFLVAIKSGK